MVEALDATVGTLETALGYMRVTVHVDDAGTVIRLAVLPRSARTCILIDLQPHTLATLAELLSRARAIIADRRLPGWQ